MRDSLMVLLLVILASCTHAPPQLVQVFSQVNRVFDPARGSWEEQLSVFVQAASSDGSRVFDRLHLLHDSQELYVSLTKDSWSAIDRPGESWFGSNGLSFPGGKIPRGAWRAMLVTRSGQKVESVFQVPPAAIDAPPGPEGAVNVGSDPTIPGRYTVTGWVSDYVVWCRDAKGTVLSQLKTVGSVFQVPGGMDSFVLYSYDKIRGVGLMAGPFSVKAVAKPADS